MQLQEIKREAHNAAIEKLAALKCKVEVIKYQNRKMYLPGIGSYMSLSQMDHLYKSGCTIQVRCAKIKTDITEEALRALAVWRIGGFNREQIVNLLENNL